ncbi:CotH kinase family protein [Nonomuraea sp. SBT364]|uniref:CotH kinase family protein n=1 Tax=Nonomuraea sp. SBT364 TaxID=1580530 RepID=UPI00069E2D8C|nr:CotH kinase family protein [Nonomuraea sp. SBT364]
MALRHRVPVKLRLHWKLVALCVAFLAACWGVFGTGTIRPYVTTGQAASPGTVVRDIAGTEDLFDPSVSHEVKLTFRDEAYEDMLGEYFKDGEKKYVEADLTIDGTTIPSVGIRLKGNSTLRGLTWKGQGRTGGGNPPEGARPPAGVQRPGGERPAGGQPRGGGFGAALKAEEPENLPWLISFDEFAEGRRYQGRTQVAVRPAGVASTAVLNEALGISVVGAAGEPTQRSTYGSFTVNGRTSAPRLLVEYLDEGYAESLGDGVLYKSLATGSFTYKGEDQTEYVEDFKQIDKVGGKDLQPVIDLVRWVNEASGEEFAAGLADRLDVESFARYLALQNLMINFDDMAGPGRNYYLWYDLGTEKFRVITWDLNLAFNGDATAGPDDTIGMGGGRGPMRTGHPLKEKFLADAGFKKLYQEQYRELYAELLAGGGATELLDGLVTAYKLNGGADAAKVDAEATSLRTLLRTRTDSLRSSFSGS